LHFLILRGALFEIWPMAFLFPRHHFLIRLAGNFESRGIRDLFSVAYGEKIVVTAKVKSFTPRRNGRNVPC
jgi:hypothetical protein